MPLLPGGLQHQTLLAVQADWLHHRAYGFVLGDERWMLALRESSAMMLYWAPSNMFGGHNSPGKESLDLTDVTQEAWTGFWQLRSFVSLLEEQPNRKVKL